MKFFAVAFAILCALGSSPEALGGASTVELTIGGNIALGDLVIPDGASLADGVLVLTHGTLLNKDQEPIGSLQTALAKRGVASFAHSLTLSRDRRTGRYDCKRPHAHAHEDAIGEIAAWIEWLKAQGAGKISLLGHSRGGNQVAWFAAVKRGVERVVLLAPALGLSGRTAAAILKRRNGADILPFLKKAVALTAQGKGETLLKVPGFIYCKGGMAAARTIASYYGEDARRNAIANLAKIDVPVLVIAGGKDRAVPDVPKKIKPIADGKKLRLEIIQQADHMFRGLHAGQAADLIAGFLKN